MSKVDDELTRRLRSAERRVDVEELFEGLERRRTRRRRVRGLQAAALAVAVLVATAAAFAALTNAFGNQATDIRNPTPSPANGEIVFSVAFASEGSTHLYAIQPDTFEERQITDLRSKDTDPAVSPDGRTIAFVHQPVGEAPGIATIPIEGGEITRLTDETVFVTSGPTWSPDGSRLAFAAHDDEGQRLLVMNADGSDLHAVTTPDLFWVAGAAWSPDGEQIAFTASTASGDIEPSRWDVYTIRPDGMELTRITHTPTPDADESGPTWDPDGRKIAFARSDTRGSSWLVVLSLSDGEETQITYGDGVDLSPAWSPDGTVLAFARSPDERTPSDVWLIRPDGSGLEDQFARGASDPTWQPIPPTDGRVTPGPSPSESPEPTGRDIGLGVAMCDLEILEGIDWDGSGIDGAAWTGAPVDEEGSCRSATLAQHVVAIDRDGDGVAEISGTSTLRTCLLCRPFDTVDLNSDGVLELVVLDEASSTPTYSLYEVNRPTSERAPGVYPILVVPPGAPAMNLDRNEPARFTVGGDEGFSGSLACEDDGAGPPIIRYTWVNGAVDADTELNVDVVRLQMGDDDVLHIHSIDSFSILRDSQPPDLITTEPACGVDFHPAA